MGNTMVMSEITYHETGNAHLPIYNTFAHLHSTISSLAYNFERTLMKIRFWGFWDTGKTMMMSK